MECMKCKAEMVDAKLSGDAYGTPAYITGKKKGILTTKPQSAVSCYVCPKCGYIELKADNPKQFIMD